MRSELLYFLSTFVLRANVYNPLLTTNAVDHVSFFTFTPFNVTQTIGELSRY